MEVTEEINYYDVVDIPVIQNNQLRDLVFRRLNSRPLDEVLYLNNNFEQLFSGINDLFFGPEVLDEVLVDIFRTLIAWRFGNYAAEDLVGTADFQDLIPFLIREAPDTKAELIPHLAAWYRENLSNITNALDHKINFIISDDEQYWQCFNLGIYGLEGEPDYDPATEPSIQDRYRRFCYQLSQTVSEKVSFLLEGFPADQRVDRENLFDKYFSLLSDGYFKDTTQESYINTLYNNVITITSRYYHQVIDESYEALAITFAHYLYKNYQRLFREVRDNSEVEDLVADYVKENTEEGNEVDGGEAEENFEDGDFEDGDDAEENFEDGDFEDGDFEDGDEAEENFEGGDEADGDDAEENFEGGDEIEENETAGDSYYQSDNQGNANSQALRFYFVNPGNNGQQAVELRLDEYGNWVIANQGQNLLIQQSDPNVQDQGNYQGYEDNFEADYDDEDDYQGDEADYQEDEADYQEDEADFEDGYQDMRPQFRALPRVMKSVHFEN